MTRRNRDADILQRRLDRAADVIEAVYDHLDEQRAIATYAGSGDGTRQRGTHADPTLQAVAKLDALDGRRREITDALASINVGVNLLEKACADALRSRASRADQTDPERSSDGEPKCEGGDPSTWGDPGCGQLVYWELGDSGHVSYDRDGLCARHRLACDEWRHSVNDESNARRKRRHNSTEAVA